MKAKSASKSPLRQTGLPYARPVQSDEPDIEVLVHFPLTPAERAAYRRDDGTKLTAKQWELYDLLMRIPRGKVTTYAELATMTGSCARAVGSTMRRNPFAPFVPCHRVIAANGFLGGFAGSWEKSGASELQQKKRKLLASEQVLFDSKGFLRGGDAMIWRGD